MAQKIPSIGRNIDRKEVGIFQKSGMKFCIEKDFFDAKSDEKGCS